MLVRVSEDVGNGQPEEEGLLAGDAGQISQAAVLEAPGDERLIVAGLADEREAVLLGFLLLHPEVACDLHIAHLLYVVQWEESSASESSGSTLKLKKKKYVDIYIEQVGDYCCVAGHGQGGLHVCASGGEDDGAERDGTALQPRQ
ncbi:hypothetical protein L7F22_062521 [Adiantum nelumboides]|nr:hypothetical protein [Adiantum nelumboides]